MSNMEKYTLSRQSFELLKAIDFSEMNDKITFIESEHAVETSDFGLMQIIVDEEITDKGLDEHQNECNEYGKKLYALYDELFCLREAEKNLPL